MSGVELGIVPGCSAGAVEGRRAGGEAVSRRPSAKGGGVGGGVGGVPVMDWVVDGRPAHGSKQFGTGSSGMDQVALRKAWFHGVRPKRPGKVVMRASAAKSQRAVARWRRVPVLGRSKRLRGPVLMSYPCTRICVSCRKSILGRFEPETVQQKGTLSRCCEHFVVRAGSLDLGES